MSTYFQTYYQRNGETIRERAGLWYRENREEAKARRLERYYNLSPEGRSKGRREQYERHKPRERATMGRYYLKNRERLLAQARRRYEEQKFSRVMEVLSAAD